MSTDGKLVIKLSDKKLFDLTKLKELGKGAYGKAYDLGQDNMVVKVFTQPYEGLEEVINIDLL